MFAKVTKAFQGRPDNEPLSRTIPEGEVISGDLARVAVEQKVAKEVPPNEKSEQPPKSALQLELEGKKVEELKALAVEKNVDLGEAARKADIVAVLLQALEQAGA
jgi:hypothetical protein